MVKTSFNSEVAGKDDKGDGWEHNDTKNSKHLYIKYWWINNEMGRYCLESEIVSV